MSTQEPKKQQNNGNYNLNVLQKIIKLDRKNSNFDFVDELHMQVIILVRIQPNQNSNHFFFSQLHIQYFRTKLKIKYNQGNSSNIAGIAKDEHDLRAYWRHVNNFYFKKIEESELSRIDYLNFMLNTEIKGMQFFQEILLQLRLNVKIQLNYTIFRYLILVNDNLDWQHIYNNAQTYECINDTLNQSYFLSEIATQQQMSDYKNLLKHFFIEEAYNNLLTRNDSKKIINKIKNFHKENQNMMKKFKGNNNKDLQKQKKKLDQLIQNIQEYQDYEGQDEILNQIEQKKKQLKIINTKNKDNINNLKSKIHLQLKNKNILFYINKKQDLLNYQPKNLKTHDQNQFNLINRIDIQLVYLKNLILRLQQKQIAESISKVLQTEKVRNEMKIIVTFQQALNIKPYSFSQQEFLRLNDVRQLSLLKFYNVSLKSMYTNISHNFVGFSQIYHRRTLVNEYKDKNLFDLMKKKRKQSNEVMKEMENFQICHHCKQLFHTNFLVKCHYRSSKMGIPVTTPSYSDPYLFQILENDFVNNANRSLLNRKKNSYMTYTKNGNQFICQRKYCKTCVKQNYDSIEKNDLCAFCQGVCFCTRCLRNDMITKLKTMYSLFGGDINELHNQSLFQKLVAKSVTYDKDQIYLSVYRPQKKKGRPRKYDSLQLKTNVKSYKKIKELKEQMDQCSLICNLVKKREKQKLRLIQQKNNVFEKKIEILNENKSIFKRNHSQIDSGKQNLQYPENHEVKQQMGRVRKLRKVK